MQHFGTFNNNNHYGSNDLILGSSPDFFQEMDMYSNYGESATKYSPVHTNSNEEDFFDAAGNSFDFLRSMIDLGDETDTDYPIQY